MGIWHAASGTNNGDCLLVVQHFNVYKKSQTNDNKIWFWFIYNEIKKIEKLKARSTRRSATLDRFNVTEKKIQIDKPWPYTGFYLRHCYTVTEGYLSRGFNILG